MSWPMFLTLHSGVASAQRKKRTAGSARWSGLCRLLVLALALWSAAAVSARAEVRLTLSAHDGVKQFGLYSIYPHAMIFLTGTVDSTGEVVDDAIGFGATSFGTHLLYRTVPGEIGRPSERGINASTDYLSVPISDETYAAIRERIAYWATPEGGVYDLRQRNCIHFVVDIGQLAGLVAPTIDIYSPNKTLIAMAALNPERTLGPRGVPHSQGPVVNAPAASEPPTPTVTAPANAGR
jgi:hypothetical protein